MRSLIVRLWMCLLGVLAWMAILLDNATTSFCLVVPCCEDFEVVEANPITRHFMGLFGIDAALLVGALLGLLVILWIYDRVTTSMTTRSIWLGSLALILLILIRGAAALNNWEVYVQIFDGVR